MDHIDRGWRLLLTAVATTGALACARETALVGISPLRTEVPPERSTDAGAEGGGLVPVREGAHARMQRVSDRFVSRGHGEHFDAVVWANDQARAALETGGDAGEGAKFVEDALFGPAGAAGAAPTDVPPQLAMEKHGGAWRFTAVEADGEAVAEARLEACGECHRGAPRDSVFRPPLARPTSQTNSATSSAAMTATAPTVVAIPAATYDAKSAGSAALPSR